MHGKDPCQPRKPIIYRVGLFVRITNYLKLFWRLLLDPRVSFLLKLIPFGALLYVISPLDRIIPVIDDLVIAGVSMYLFIELCPPEIVLQHRKVIEGVLEGQWREAPDDEKINEEDIQDGEFHE
jgi:uncharacterized membrane protein YkvA (DUF1232 family)